MNRNPDVPFCALSADNALEHVNRSMKVTRGLTGITLNPIARAKFFLIAQELARLADQAKETGSYVFNDTRSTDPYLVASVLQRKNKNIDQVLATLPNFTNPFKEERDELLNLLIKVVMPEKV